MIASSAAPLPVRPDAPVPDHAHRVIVPLANPDTAVELLTIARAIVRSDGGTVLALVVVLGDADAEANLDRTEAVRAIVDTMRARDGRVAMEVVTRPAAAIARGILDAARDEGADLIVLGVQAPTPGGVAVGGVTEQVIRTADCDVLVYRRGRTRGLDDIAGVVVGVDGSPDARVAARTGMILAQGLGEPVEALHVQRPGETDEQAALTLDRAVRGLDGEAHCGRRVVAAATATDGLRRHIGADRLAVVGFHSRADLMGERLGRTTRGALDRLRGPVVAISRPDRAVGPAAALQRLARHLRPRLTDVEEQSLVWHARLNATLSTDVVVLSVVAAVIATLGLLLDSAAVIIGAMLVAPLMSPIVAFGTALVDGEVRTLRRAASTTGVGTALVAVTAVVIGLFGGGDPPTSEMLARGSPSVVDAAVAAASGVIGGYASARRGIPAALAGVAIAAALVPPICVFGLALTTDPQLALGAGLLFVTNIACIAAAAAAVLLWLGVHLERSGRRRTRYVRFTAPVVVGVLVALVLFGLASRGPDLTVVQQVVADELPGVEVVDARTSRTDGTVTVTVLAPTPPSPDDVAAAVERVAREHGGARLRLAVQQLLTGP